jgi:hypothetical protein
MAMIAVRQGSISAGGAPEALIDGVKPYLPCG